MDDDDNDNLINTSSWSLGILPPSRSGAALARFLLLGLRDYDSYGSVWVPGALKRREQTEDEILAEFARTEEIPWDTVQRDLDLLIEAGFIVRRTDQPGQSYLYVRWDFTYQAFVQADWERRYGERM